MLTRSFNTKVEGQLATLLDRQQSLQTSIPAAIDIYQKDTQARIVAQTKSLICLQGDTPDDILTRLKRIENGDVHQRRSLSRAIGAVESLSAAVHSNQSKLHDRLDSLEAIMQRSTTLESPQDLTGSDAICRAVRAEMRNIMLSLADDVAGSETWRKDLFKNTVDSVADQIGRDLQFSKLHAESSSSHSQQTTDESFSAPWDTSNKNSFTKKPHRQLVQHRIWTYKCSFGSITFRLTTLKYLTIFSTRRITKITATFIPSLKLNLRGLSSMFSFQSDHAGFYGIEPTFRIVNVIPEDGLIWTSIRRNDIAQIQRLFVERLASPFDVDQEGYTVLHVSSFVFPSIEYIL
jgi:hypothetical protein